MTNKFIARTVCLFICFFVACVVKTRLLQWKFTSSFCKFSRDLLMAVYQMISSGVCERDLESQTRSLLGAREPASTEKSHDKLRRRESVQHTRFDCHSVLVHNLLIYYQQNCLFFFLLDFVIFLLPSSVVCARFCRAFLLLLPCTPINCTNFQRSLTHCSLRSRFFCSLSPQYSRWHVFIYIHDSIQWGTCLASEKLKQIFFPFLFRFNNELKLHDPLNIDALIDDGTWFFQLGKNFGVYKKFICELDEKAQWNRIALYRI